MDAWAAWVEWELPNADAEGKARALAAAREVLDRGGTPPDAALAAALAALEPRGPLTAEAITEARAQLEAQRVASAGRKRAAYAAAPAPPSPPAPAAARPSIGGLFSENSVLILGMTGAFLLVVATVLFELYGATQLGGSLRFGAVAALAATFGVAAWFCLGSVRLRMVGHVYLAVFALMVPLAFVAAYTFLDLGRQGISVPTAVGLTGLACAGLYSGLAARLRAAPYAWLAVVALLVGWTGAADALFGQPWAGPVTALLVTGYALAAVGAPRLFRTPALVSLHTPWVPALLLALPPFFGPVPTAVNEAFTATFAVVAGGYAAHALLQRRAGWLLPAAVALTAAMAWLDSWQGWGPEVAAATFVALGAALAATSWWAPGAGRWSGALLRAGAAAEVWVAAVLPARHALPQALALVAGTALLAAMARRQRNPYWLAAATPVLALAWYWSGVALLPPPEHPGTDTLAQLFVPLPALAGLVAIGLRLRVSRVWGAALGVPAALGGLVVAALAAASNDLQLAAAALLVYGALAYLAGALARSPAELVAGLIGIGAGVMTLLGARGSPAAGYILAAAVGSAAIYALQQAWRASPALVRVHRVSGLLGLAGVVAVDLLVSDLYAWRSTADLAAVLAALVLAGVLAADARLNAFPLADYGAVVAAGLAPAWLAGWLGAADPLWYVLGPGVGLTAAGLRLPYDRRLPRRPLLDRLLVALGAATLLGPETVQLFQADAQAGPHLARLLVGGVAGLLAGIGLRSRVLVIAGSLGIVAAALRALFVALESVQPYVLFGAVALALLAAAALLAGLRGRVGGARSAVASSWADWN